MRGDINQVVKLMRDSPYLGIIGVNGAIRGADDCLIGEVIKFDPIHIFLIFLGDNNFSYLIIMEVAERLTMGAAEKSVIKSGRIIDKEGAKFTNHEKTRIVFSFL